MRVLPDNYFPPEADTEEKQFQILGKRLFAADPAKLREKLDAEPPLPEEGAPRKPGRPRKARSEQRESA